MRRAFSDIAVATVHDVINCGGIFDGQRAGHGNPLPPHRICVNSTERPLVRRVTIAIGRVIHRARLVRDARAVVPDRVPRAQPVHGRLRRGDEIRSVGAGVPNVSAHAAHIGRAVVDHVIGHVADAVRPAVINRVIAIAVRDGVGGFNEES